MEFKELLETINFDLVLEGIGTIFGFGLLWKLFVGNDIRQLLELFITSIC